MNQMTPAAAAIILICLIAVTLLIRAVWETRQLTVSKIVVEKKNTQEGLPGVCFDEQSEQTVCVSAIYKKNISSQDILPHDEANRFRIIQLSDLHADHLFISPARLIQTISSAQPDLIVFTGDLTGKDKHIAKGLSLLKTIQQDTVLSTIPFAAVPGNHDTEETIAGMKALGITILANAHCSFSSAAGPVQIVGLEDLRTGQPNFEKALRTCITDSMTARTSKKILDNGSKKIACETPNAASVRSCPTIFSDRHTDNGPDHCAQFVFPADGHRVILAHNPDTVFNIPEKAASIMLTGHFHGGQIWMPFRFEFIMLREEKLPRMGITQGLTCFRGLQLYISRGLGCVSIPLRLFSLPELAVIDLMREETYDKS